MIQIWYNGDMDAETPEYYIYNGRTRIGWIKNVDEDGYVDEILIYNSYRNMGYGKEALIALMNLEKRDLKLDFKKFSIPFYKVFNSCLNRSVRFVV